ncbi:SURF1 family protein [Ralstonia solanacearum]|uniref:SURF1 family protein n=1 Tax=Ralstonia solanacearum TaxID=305 RepID=UPI00018169FC|nr:SURF1 family protein [Ralstonia solanacearum]MDC6177337.1 SURF1 family protein [Ralstonia solanacearum]MDC6211591.1 SURF1 family protein [Ralstonia solanacearum]MDC6238867.1 SURF1 family protein [Ralstonia solanacearum]MDD7802110.1 SURF1 family protein [Ralstonia solanacearum]TYZ54213.1 SURF1 family protein [Ralstonia solanacearum]
MTARVGFRQWFAPVPMLAGVAMIALTCALGRWQLSRAQARIERQARIEAMAHAPALRVSAQPVAADVVMYRPVLLRGTFDVAHTVLLENRPHVTNGVSRPGFEVLIPLVLEGAGGRAVLVNRGWLPRDPVERTRIAPYTTPTGEVQVEGIAVPHASRVYSFGRKDGADEAGQRLRQNIDLDAFAREIGVPLQPFVVEQQSDAQDGLQRDWPRADSGADRNYGYAFQWFSMATAVLALMIVYGVRRYRRLIEASSVD